MVHKPGADMTTSEVTSETSTSANSTGVYLAVLQLVFTLGWTTYVIYLPKLCAEVGIAPSAVILILMLDQAIFTITDTAMGIAADRIAPFVGKLGVFVGVLTAISCAAFVALPFVAGTGPGAQVWFIGLILIWVVTSSALRAPPLTLLGKYGARPAIPFLSALAMLGYGLAGAVSPYLGVVLRNHDPRLPFVISGVVLLITTLALSKVERDLAQAPPVAKQPARRQNRSARCRCSSSPRWCILSLGYQLHFSINSTPFFLRFAKPDDLQWLMPVFWIGFNIAMFPASVVVKHRGGLIVMGAAGLLGRAGGARRGNGRQPQHADRGAVHRRCGVGLHADGRGLGGAGDRRDRRRGQGGRAGVLRAGARDLCADGGGRRRPAEAAGIRAAAAMGAGGVLVGRRRRPAGDRGVAGAARGMATAGS